MSLRVTIRNIRFSPPRPELKANWVRQLLSLEELSKSVPVIENCNLLVNEDEVIAIVGASGIGKTTLLRIIAGLETRYEGSVTLNEDRIEKPDKRIYLMPQAHTLLPWLTVEGNMMFNVDDVGVVNMPKDLLATFHFLDKRKRYPSTLSGGERARVALMCAMCATPEVILLDEPFRGLDQITSEECQVDLLNWLEETPTKESVILVSHNIPDAVYLADRVLVVSPSPPWIFKEISTSSVRERRSGEFANLESEVFDALLEVATQQGDAADAVLTPA